MASSQPPSQVPANPAVSEASPRAVQLLVTWLWASVAASLAAAITLAAAAGPSQRALEAATWGLFIVVFLWVIVALFWGQINPRARDEPDLAELLRGAANVVITVDGVVLGLIFTFSGIGKSAVPLSLKVGAVALVVGVVVGVLLYALVAGKVTTRGATAIATGLFSLIAWAMAYGLLCICFTLTYAS